MIHLTPPAPPMAFAGVHLIADLFDCQHLADMPRVEAALRDAAAAAGATLLDLNLHGFGPGAGITGVALLAESHISIHSWPEHGAAAVDIFLCGSLHRLDQALAVLVAAFEAQRVVEQRILRGLANAECEIDENLSPSTRTVPRKSPFTPPGALSILDVRSG